MIVKIQRPLWSNAPGKPMALIYPKGRSWEALLPFDGELAGLFGPADLKIYAEARFEGTELHVERLLIGDEALDW